MNLYLDIETTLDHKTIRLVGALAEDDGLFITTDPLQLGPCTIPYDQIVTYNGEGFDYPVLEKVAGLSLKIPHLDLFILSKLFFDRKSHSLDSWAEEMDPTFRKLTVDYDHASIHELGNYLERDLHILKDLYHYMMKKINALMDESEWRHAYKVEQRVRQLMNLQKDRGFPFDVTKAKTLVHQMDQAMWDIRESTAPMMPVARIPESQLKYPPKKQFKKDGSISALMTKYAHDHGCAITYNCDEMQYYVLTPGGLSKKLPLTDPIKTVSEICISETNRLKEYCMSQGWEPTWWNTDKDGNQTSPQLVNRDSKQPCPGLAGILPDEVVDQLSNYAVTKSRRTSIKPMAGDKSGLVNRVTKHGDEFVIHHDADTLGTPTSRMRHKGIVNIPRTTSAWGKEMRELFIPPEDHVMVGWDASSLEARMEAHYTYPLDADYANELVEGDVHERNKELLDLPDRDSAKKFKYMLMYGARPAKIAQSMGCDMRTAERWYEDFWNGNLALLKLTQILEKEWMFYGEQYLKGLDGRLIPTRMKHALLNSKLQGAGAVVMKHALLLAEKTIIRDVGRHNAHALIRYHDEEQWAAKFGWAHRVGKLGVDSIVNAGLYLRLNVPLDGEYKIGSSWAETH